MDPKATRRQEHDEQPCDDHEGNDDAGGGGDPADDEREYLGRKVAEWVTLGLSVVIVTGLAGYILYQALREDAPYIPAEVRPLMDQVGREGGKYFLPVEVHNRGRRTLRDFRAELTYRTTDGKQETRDIKIDFLAERARETRYFYFDQDPRGLQVEARPLGYGLR